MLYWRKAAVERHYNSLKLPQIIVGTLWYWFVEFPCNIMISLHGLLFTPTYQPGAGLTSPFDISHWCGHLVGWTNEFGIFVAGGLVHPGLPAYLSVRWARCWDPSLSVSVILCQLNMLLTFSMLFSQPPISIHPKPQHKPSNEAASL